MTDVEYDIIHSAVTAAARRGLYGESANLPNGFYGTFIVNVGILNNRPFLDWFELNCPADQAWMGAVEWFPSQNLPHRWPCFYSHSFAPCRTHTVVTRDETFLNAVYAYPETAGQRVHVCTPSLLVFGTLTALEQKLLSRQNPALLDDPGLELMEAEKAMEKVRAEIAHQNARYGELVKEMTLWTFADDDREAE